MRKSTELLKDKVGQYVFTSSISVYPLDSFQKPGKDESADVLPWPKGTDEKTHDMQLYGNTKARCEKILMDTFGDRATVIRPGLIVGEGDYSDRFTYWPVRIDKGGEILAPGTPNDFTQFIDARDLGDWCVKVVEDGHHGIYNATGPYKPLPMAGLLFGIKAVVSNDATFTWVDESFLEQQHVGAWMEMPVWIGSSPEMIGFSQVSIDKAVAHGLKFRPLADTAKVTLDWAKTRPASHKWRAGITPEKESAVLKAWHERSGATTAPTTPKPG
jgi:2'-hydroxyisoflavone reductase